LRGIVGSSLGGSYEEKGMRLAVLAAGTAMYLAIGWAVLFHFVSRTRPLGFLLFTLAGTANFAVFAYLLWFQEMDGLGFDLWSTTAALVLIIAGGLLFGWAVVASWNAKLKLIFDLDRPRFVLRSGPYAYIRHPFYAAYILYWAGCALATLHWANIGFLVGATAALAHAALAEERGFAATRRAEAYASYRRRAGLFWPRLGQ
jgi:protein-S-isoprenylcysteine O-methyltransferase Ste14